jgi:hypothetical protein
MVGKSTRLIKTAIARLGRLVKGRRRILKRGDRFDARLHFIVTLAATRKDQARRATNGLPSLVGFTRNLSETGLTLLLPSVRIGDAYITDAENCLEIKLELPLGPVVILAAPVRFEQLPKREAGCGYLLAVCIVSADGAERERYIAYVRTGGVEERRSPEKRKAPATVSGSNNATQAGKWETLTTASISKAFEQFVRE